MRKITKRSAALVAGVALAVTGGTAAFAYAQGWFKGTGNVTASASTIQTVTTTIDLRSGGVDNNLFPGKSVAIAGTVTNDNDYPVKVNSIEVLTLTSDKANCGKNEADLVFEELPANTVVAKKTSSPNVPLGKVKMLDTADPLCSGAVFTITGKMNGEISPA